ncbi:hypothetical protein DPMN_160480 [Dreissena polymorpha]|uniref:Uncharacterized protein n=1 Tax=Dreissena polymorpha TaxID=45954 RepID=A0A9D4ENJ4_DREPO|nr:hypothetical protein DPMN_160480 [Dreissena polymorpha]
MEKSLAFITNQMKSKLKREEIETLITNTITSIITEVERRNEEHINQMKNDLAKELKLQMQQCVNKQVEEKTKDLTAHMKNLEFEKESLKETITSLRAECKQTIDNMSSQVNENSRWCSEAIKRSNYNAQYSIKKVENTKCPRRSSRDNPTTYNKGSKYTTRQRNPDSD